MPSTVEVILKLTDKLSKEMKGVGKNVKGLKVDLKSLAVAGGAMVGVLGGIGIAAKGAFEFGKRGAIVTQTAESFDLLIEKVGASSDLLEQLGDASKGTISDMGLMSSTATLLAGASGELATNLADATPELLEIAKAANKLNPSLGDTTFLYESIAKGVKRASPLILDNLGIIIKVEEAYSAMAKSLGKTVDALDSGERSQAILNETLKAGRVLIDQVGGSTDSATDSFLNMEAAVKNLKDELAREAAPAVSEFVDHLLDVIKSQGLVSDAFSFGIEVQNEWADVLFKSIFEAETMSDVLEDLEERVTDATEASEMAARATDFHSWALERQVRMLDRSTTAWADWDHWVGTATETIEVSRASMEDLNEAAVAAIADFQETLSKPTPFEWNLEISDINIGGDITRMIDDILFEMAGGADITRAMMRIKEAVISEKITPEEGIKFLGDLFIIDQAALVRANQQTMKEAGKNIADEFGIGFQEAMGLLETEASLDPLIQGLENALQIAQQPELTGDRNALVMLAENSEIMGKSAQEAIAPLILVEEAVEGVGASAQNAQGRVITFQQALDALEDKTVTLTFEIETIGSIPSFGGGGGGISEVRQRGGPVIAGRSYIVGEAGPEMFVPSASGDIVASDKVGGDTFIIEQNFHNQAAAIFAYDEIWNMRDKRDNRMMGV